MRQYSLSRIAWTGGKIILSGGGLWLGTSTWAWYRAQTLRPPIPPPHSPTLVLGCRPGARFNRRLDAAYDLVCRGYSDRIVVSGKGESPYGRAYLLNRGLSETRILTEPDATNTIENLTFSRTRLGTDRPWIVSCRWHLPRALVLARQVGMDPHAYPVDEGSNTQPRARHYLREGLSIIHHMR
ncbi:MAG: YdcF family protein [Myxococcota bacterium]|nr:YdcF family protein [Myxococcota bacterium]